MLTPEEQYTGLKTARDHLMLGQNDIARMHLLDLIRDTPTESVLYAVMISAANWLKPLNRPDLAIAGLTKFFLAQSISDKVICAPFC